MTISLLIISSIFSITIYFEFYYIASGLVLYLILNMLNKVYDAIYGINEMMYSFLKSREKYDI